ncbi:MAG: TIGR03435 family protein [Bryobacteraceae bacterium]
MGTGFLIGVCAAVALAEAQTAPPQKAAAPLAFEVASIKPAEPLSAERMMAGQQHINVNVDAARVDFSDLSLAELIRAAYRVKLYQISGPDWMTTSRFDVVAKLPEGAKTDQVPEMLRTLLGERFHLVLHNSSKEMPVYALVVGKEGSKLKESTPDDATDGAGAAAGGSAAGGAGGRRGEGASPMTSSGSGPNGSYTMSAGSNGLHMDLKNVTIGTMIDWLSRFTDKPVVDQTGLAGRYDLSLDASRDEMLNAARAAGMVVDAVRRAPEAATEPGGDSVFASVQKVGLKLVPRRLPLPLLVVDHLDKTPTEN